MNFEKISFESIMLERSIFVYAVHLSKLRQNGSVPQLFFHFYEKVSIRDVKS